MTPIIFRVIKDADTRSPANFFAAGLISKPPLNDQVAGTVQIEPFEKGELL
jgi:hypothetical protein